MSVHLENQIEAQWGELTETRHPRRFYLTGCGKLAHGPPPEGAAEVGTFTRSITLFDFRQEVFFVYGQLKGRGHG